MSRPAAQRKALRKPGVSGKRKAGAKPATRPASPANRGLFLGLAWIQFRALRA